MDDLMSGIGKLGVEDIDREIALHHDSNRLFEIF
jgi:hypothetical protein